MLSGIRWRRALSQSKRSLRVRAIAWFFVPTAIILVAVALVNFYAYQDVTEELVIERDRDLTRLSAAQLATDLEEYTDTLADIASSVASSQNDPTAQHDALRQASRQLVVFDSGVLVLDISGTVVAAEPEQPGLLGQDWSDRSHFRQMIRSPRPIFSNIINAGSQEAGVIIVAVPVIGDQRAFLGSVVGMFSLSATAASAFYGGIVKLRIGESGTTYLVDGDGRVIYHSDTDRIGEDFSTQPVVQQVLDGQVGAIRTRDFEGGNIVAGFAPVRGTPWSLITEESWSALTSGSRGYQRFLILLLALGVAVPVLIVIVGLRRIMRPVEALIVGAREVARENFGQTITATSGDEIEELAREFNLMAAQLQESYEHLEQRVADRTRDLSASEERYRAVFEQSRDAIFIAQNGIVVDTNQAALDLFGFTRQEATGSKVGDRYADPADRETFREEIAKHGSIMDFEVKMLKRDGTVMDCLLTASRQSDLDGTGERRIQGLVRDITERKLMEEQGRDLAVLEERNRMAREIHDTLAQGFTGIILQLEAADQVSDGSTAELGDHLDRAKSLARESLQEARRSMWGLLPHALERHSLDAALQEEVDLFSAGGPVAASFSVSGVRRDLPPDVQTAIFRICQESLTNVRRHAGATEVKVDMSFSPESVRLKVKDNGVGFDVDGVKARGEGRGFGLTGMEQRATLLGGTLSVTGQNGKGAVVEVIIPIT